MNHPVITKAEWDAIPRDYKGTWKGKPTRLVFEPGVGTTIQVVEIVATEIEKVRRLKELGLLEEREAR